MKFQNQAKTGLVVMSEEIFKFLQYFKKSLQMNSHYFHHFVHYSKLCYTYLYPAFSCRSEDDFESECGSHQEVVSIHGTIGNQASQYDLDLDSEVTDLPAVEKETEPSIELNTVTHQRKTSHKHQKVKKHRHARKKVAPKVDRCNSCVTRYWKVK